MKFLNLTMLSTVCIGLTACHVVPTSKQNEPVIGMPNPASVYCVEKGGKSIAKKHEDGGEYALCELPSGQIIEEWKLFHQDHPQK